jgi:pimeloyl-ACP methyl ester carboxylesterase
VDNLPFTPEWMGSPLVAFGLTSKVNIAPPLLLFKGTTYPTDDGFGLSLVTDINPFASVGKYGFKLGEKKISTWLKAHTTHAKARVYGKSLGGALAWQTALGYPSHVEKCMTYGAPGFRSVDLKRCKQLEEQKALPPIYMFYQENDPVAIVDEMANSGIHYMVLGKHCRKGVAAHADIYSTHEISSIIRLKPHEQTSRWLRFTMTMSRLIASISLFPLLISICGAKIALIQTGKVMKCCFFPQRNNVATNNEMAVINKL